MEEKWKETFKLHAQTEEYEKKILDAKKIIRQYLSEKCYVAFSGGKDSIVMTCLILKEKPDVLVYHHDLKYIPNVFKREIRSILKNLGVYNLEIRGEQESLWDDIIPSFIRRGYTNVFIGLREEESAGRRFRIRKNVFLSKIKEVYPIRNWSWLDVWGFIVDNGLPYPSSYDVYASVVGWDRVRFHSFFDPSMNKFGCTNIDGVLLWKKRWEG